MDTDSRSLLTILRRGCVVDCPSDVDCSKCSADERCKLVTQTCSTCAYVKCIPTSNSNNVSSDDSSKSNTGAIVGGVVGGVVALLAIFCLWWFCMRRRKSGSQNEVEKNMPSDIKSQPDESAPPQPQVRRSLAPSMASTVLTRTSNFIPIAYIPGFGNRANGSSAQDPNSGDRYFTPQELRDSVYSDASSGRASITPSLARSSVATTLYRGDAVISAVPAQQAIGGKAAVVSVKPGPGSEINPQRTLSSTTSGSTGNSMLGSFTTAPAIRSPLARSMTSSDENGSVDSSRPGGIERKIPVSGSIVARTMTPRTINIHSNKSGVTKQPMTIPEGDEAKADAEAPEDTVLSSNAPKIVITEADHIPETTSSTLNDSTRTNSSEGPFADPPTRVSSDSSRPGNASVSGPFDDAHEVR